MADSVFHAAIVLRTAKWVSTLELTPKKVKILCAQVVWVAVSVLRCALEVCLNWRMALQKVESTAKMFF